MLSSLQSPDRRDWDSECDHPRGAAPPQPLLGVSSEDFQGLSLSLWEEKSVAEVLRGLRREGS